MRHSTKIISTQFDYEKAASIYSGTQGIFKALLSITVAARGDLAESKDSMSLSLSINSDARV